MIIRVARVRQSLAGLRQGATDAPQKTGSRGRTVAVRAGTIGELDGIDLPAAVTSQAKGASPTPSRQRGVELVTRVQAERVGSRTEQSGPEGDVIVWQRPNKPRGMTGEQSRSNPKSLTMRQVSVDARDQNNRAEQFKVVTTILSASISVTQIGALYQRRWDGEVDRRSIKSTMKMDVLRCKMPEMVRKEIWVHLRRTTCSARSWRLPPERMASSLGRCASKGPSKSSRRSPRSLKLPGRTTGHD